jgi:hypothetical protein
VNQAPSRPAVQLVVVERLPVQLNLTKSSYLLARISTVPNGGGELTAGTIRLLEMTKARSGLGKLTSALPIKFADVEGPFSVRPQLDSKRRIVAANARII